MMWSHRQNHLCSKSKVIGLRLVEESLSTRGRSFDASIIAFLKYDGFLVWINGDLNYFGQILKTNTEISNFSKP